MNAVPDDRQTPGEVMGGLLAAVSIFVSCASVVFHPLRLIVLSVILALLATAMAREDSRLPGIAVAVGTAAFVVGMTIAVTADRPLW